MYTNDTSDATISTASVLPLSRTRNPNATTLREDCILVAHGGAHTDERRGTVPTQRLSPQRSNADVVVRGRTTGVASTISRIQMHIGSRQKESRKLQPLNVNEGDRGPTLLIAEANHIKILTHAPLMALSRSFVSLPLPASSASVCSSASLPCFRSALAPLGTQWHTREGEQEGGGTPR
jgi:hypothetical protein